MASADVTAITKGSIRSSKARRQWRSRRLECRRRHGTATAADDAAAGRPSSYIIELRDSRPSKKAAREPGRAAFETNCRFSRFRPSDCEASPYPRILNCSMSAERCEGIGAAAASYWSFRDRPIAVSATCLSRAEFTLCWPGPVTMCRRIEWSIRLAVPARRIGAPKRFPPPAPLTRIPYVAFPTERAPLVNTRTPPISAPKGRIRGVPWAAGLPKHRKSRAQRGRGKPRRFMMGRLLGSSSPLRKHRSAC
jgi:hypothetical protein